MSHNWWKEPDTGVPPGERDGCSAARMWRSACTTLCAPGGDEAWKHIVDTSPPDDMWHSLRNCVAYQAGVWQKMVSKGEIPDVVHPAAFKLAIVLRHTPPDLAVKLLADLLHLHPQYQDLTNYVLALLTDDNPIPSEFDESVVTLRDLQLFGDCELSILAASREEYDAHSKLVRAEYYKLTHRAYVELRIKILNQLSSIPQLFHTPEFARLEEVARENVAREIATLTDHLLSARGESS